VTPQEFAAKWKASELRESAGAQSHFNDLCALIHERTPAEADPKGEWFTFEKGAQKAQGGKGWADVWRKGRFGWEYKGKHKDLDAAYAQLLQYAPALDSPPLLIVSDMETIRIHTHFTNAVHQVHDITLDGLTGPDSPRLVRMLRDAFNNTDALKPGQTREDITQEAAKEFGDLAQRLRERGYEAQTVAHFINRLLFCLFAEDIGILPNKVFERLLARASEDPKQFQPLAAELFRSMRSGGLFGLEKILWFNGGLFDNDDALPLEKDDLIQLHAFARKEWSDIEPSIFGTLFERGLDPDKRSQLGAHYTNPEKIELIIKPVVLEPVRAEWERVKGRIREQLERARKSKGEQTRRHARQAAETAFHQFRHELSTLRVLDPACGSGNFLYLSLLGLKNLEHQVLVEAEELGLGRGHPEIDPSHFLGLEINPFAAELARVTIWIGQIQWTLRHGFYLEEEPILKPLNTIECRDALLNPDWSEAQWPEADCIVGNPPFLGGSKMLGVLGEDYVTRLRATFGGRVQGGADLVTYWFEKARAQIEARRTSRAGLVATNSIRGGANRKVLERIRDTGTIFNAHSDEKWTVEGAAVRVSLVCFAKASEGAAMLDKRTVDAIGSNLSAIRITAVGEVDPTKAHKLRQNLHVSFEGVKKHGSFDISGETARSWLMLPANPNGKGNQDVLRPLINAYDVTHRPQDIWVIDFGVSLSEGEAAHFDKPYAHTKQFVKPERDSNRREAYRKFWWRLGEARPGMRDAIALLRRYIATPRVAKHRFFVWMHLRSLPDSRLNVIARDDDCTFGVLHGRIHEVWTLATCSWHGVGNDPTYNAHSVFETFPFPEGLTPDISAAEYADDPRAKAIAEAARELDRLRNNWLNPPEWVRREPEVVPGYPDRLIPVDEKAAKELKKRTLTNLYNERPQWLANAHRALDEAVAAAYGWPADLSEEEVLSRLLALNLERAGKE
jgi:type II restriction/modification system DNA methylase subunit YeeA